MTRFMVVHHPNMLKDRLPIHHHLYNYHGVSLDDAHLLILANLPESNLEILENHDATYVLPSLYDPRTIHEHANAKAQAMGKMAGHFDKHLAALRVMGIDHTHKTADLAHMAAEKFRLHLDA